MVLCGCHVLQVYLVTSYNGRECTYTFFSVQLSFPSSGEPYIHILLPMHQKNQKSFRTVATMSDSNRVTEDSFTTCKDTMIKEAQKSIALLLQEIQNHRSHKYPTQQKIIQPKTQIKFSANREVRRNREVEKNKEVTAETPSTKTASPTSVSMEKRRKVVLLQRKGKKEWYCQLQLAAAPPSATREKTLH
jgi:hypothetical protein